MSIQVFKHFCPLRTLMLTFSRRDGLYKCVYFYFIYFYFCLFIAMDTNNVLLWIFVLLLTKHQALFKKCSAIKKFREIGDNSVTWWGREGFLPFTIMCFLFSLHFLSCLGFVSNLTGFYAYSLGWYLPGLAPYHKGGCWMTGRISIINTIGYFWWS